MIGKNGAIRKYISKLPQALSTRYGGGTPYTEAQVTVTIDELGLNKRFIQYAFLMYCQEEVIAEQGIDDETAATMLKVIEKAHGGGIVGTPLGALFGSDGDGGGFGDGGGGGGE